MPQVKLLGGWGYNNLGDEAILAGYLETLSPHADVVVSSRDADRTRRAQRTGVGVRSEGSLGSSSADLGILCGGGYLNGSWVPEIALKLRRLQADRQGCERFCAHGLEVRGLAGSPMHKRVRSLLGDVPVAVRDQESVVELQSIVSTPPRVMPDAISLLYPHLERYIQPVPELSGKVLLNLLDIRQRPDRDEFELELDGYLPYVQRLVQALGDSAVGLVIGDGDLKFQREFPDLQLIAPNTVGQLVSSLKAAAGVVSVRMHPALLATALGTPVTAIPYCGKVVPTLRQLGVERAVLTHLDAERTLDELTVESDFSGQWGAAHRASADWLLGQLPTASP